MPVRSGSLIQPPPNVSLRCTHATINISSPHVSFVRHRNASQHRVRDWGKIVWYPLTSHIDYRLMCVHVIWPAGIEMRLNVIPLGFHSLFESTIYVLLPVDHHTSLNCLQFYLPALYLQKPCNSYITSPQGEREKKMKLLQLHHLRN